MPVRTHTRHVPAALAAAGRAALAAVTAFAAPALTLAMPPGSVSSPEMPMDDYLGLLAQISPAAHIGARAYLDAHRRRCGRDLTSAELRAAMAVGQGDPTLMAMIRASHLQDPSSLKRLDSQVACRKATP
jgi:hypothetical protein